MSSRFKRHTMGVLAAAMIAAVLSACGGGGSATVSDQRPAAGVLDDVPAYAGPVTPLPADVSRLYAASGNPFAPRVVLFLQGGPVDMLSSADQLDDLQVDWEDQLLVRVHQANTLNPAIVGDPDLSYERAIRENEQSVEILNRVIRHFAGQGKQVVVAGHSFGAFLILRAIAEHPDLQTLVDRFLVMNGRLDMPDVVWQSMRHGVQWKFPSGGDPAQTAVQPTRESLEGDEYRGPGDLPLTNTFSWSQLKLQADIGRPRMTRVLAGRRLDRVVVVESTADEAVGRLSAAEKAFLKTAGAPLYCIQGGTHDSAFEAPYAAELTALLFGATTQTRRCD